MSKLSLLEERSVSSKEKRSCLFILESHALYLLFGDEAHFASGSVLESVVELKQLWTVQTIHYVHFTFNVSKCEKYANVMSYLTMMKLTFYLPLTSKGRIWRRKFAHFSDQRISSLCQISPCYNITY